MASSNLESEMQRSRSPLESVAEETEGYRPIPVTPQTDLTRIQLLVEDSNLQSLTPTLEAALRHFIANYPRPVAEISKNDLIRVVIYVVALETGLTPRNCPMPSFGKSKMPQVYRSFDKRLVHHFGTQLSVDSFASQSNLYSMDLCLMPIRVDENNYFGCKLTSLVSGDLLIVSLVPAGVVPINSGFSVALPISRYVPLVNTERLAVCFQRLKELSYRLKTEVFVPFRNNIHHTCLTYGYPSLIGLPVDIHLELTKYLDGYCFEHLRASCPYYGCNNEWTVRLNFVF
ncbi:uncharacterized protein LOC131216379 isoform X1 [Anopheles bellator]|uniref:uncharacterized protein LOC131216379 isoform X1 n=1 Tax=Anopheles bellator TaxID=139047 RepID=UPI002648305A|nr:uncharacterized protein LOC131216379 isoform X1 [Anopheles bellator]